MLTTLRTVVLTVLTLGFAGGSCFAESWSVDRLWGVRTSLDDPRVAQGIDTLTLSLDLTPGSAQGDFLMDVEVIDAEGRSISVRRGVEPGTDMELDLTDADPGIITLRALVQDEQGGERALETYVYRGDWAVGKDRLGQRARRALRSIDADPLGSAALRFASHWGSRGQSRCSDRHTLLFRETQRAVDLVEQGEPFPARTAIPMAIQNPLASVGVGIDLSRFWLMLPDGYEDRTDWPLVIFLHGSGGRWADMTSGLYGPVRSRMERVGIPAVVLIAKSDSDGLWEPGLLDGMLDWTLRHTRADVDRVLLTGLSMGGKGTWEWAMASPDRFAALAPVCGNANPILAQRIAHIPVWNTHGTADPLVDFYLSAHMHLMLERFGADHEFDARVGEGHTVWQHRYEDDAFWGWFLAQTRPQHRLPQRPIVFDANGLSAGELIDLPTLALAHQELGRSWDGVAPQANSRIAGNFYQPIYELVSHEGVHGPHGFGEVDGVLSAGVLVRADSVPDGTRRIGLSTESFNRNLRRDRRAGDANLRERPDQLQIVPFEFERVWAVWFAGERSAFDTALRSARESAAAAGHSVVGEPWTRVWWDSWDDGSCVREIWLGVE